MVSLIVLAKLINYGHMIEVYWKPSQASVVGLFSKNG